MLYTDLMSEALASAAEIAKSAGLHPDLAESLEETPFGIWVKHPLLISPLFYHPEGVEMLNQGLQAKREGVMAAIRSGNWLQVIWLHERPWRPDVLATKVPAELAEFWDLASRVWTDTEFPHAREALWRDLFTRPDAHKMMDEEEREFFSGLPDIVEIYRGAAKGIGEKGFSWTLDRQRAEWFSRRFTSGDDEAIVLEGVVSKKNIIAYISGRNEEEILVLPEKVTIRVA